MAKVGTINEVIDVKAVEDQFNALNKMIDALVVKIEAVNSAASKVKGAGNPQQQAAAQKQANQAAQEAIAINAKLTEEEIKQARAKAEKAYRAKLANDAAKQEINLNAQIVGAYKALQTEVSRLGKAYADLAAAGKGNTKEAKALKEAYDKQREALTALNRDMGKHQDDVGRYGKALEGIKSKFAMVTAGWAAGTAALAGVVSFMKQAIQGAMDDERAAKRLSFALDGNTAAMGRMMRFKDRLMERTLFSEEEIMGAINMGTEMGRTESQTRKLVETAMGLSRLTGQDLNTAMMQLSATYEGQTGKLGKLDGDIKGLTETQLKNGEAVDILNKKYGKLASEGMQTTEGQVLQMKKWWGETMDEIGVKFMEFAQGLQTGFRVISAMMGGGRGLSDEQKEAKRIAGQRKQIQDIQDNIGSMRNAGKATDDLSNKNKKLKTSTDQQTASIERQNEEYERQLSLVNRMLGAMGLEQMTIDKMTSKGMPEAISKEPGRKIGGKVENQFQTETLTGAEYENYIAEQQSAEAEAWNQRLQIASDTLSKIDELVNASFAKRMMQIDQEAAADEAAKERELKAAGNSTAKIREINDRYDAKEKEREKEKRRVQREQAKYQKTSALIQAVINTALGVTAALTQTPPLSFVLAALTLAAGIAETAMIASQPLPSYRKGRKGGPAEIANINEAGQEAVITKSGEMYFPSGPVAYLPQGSSVIPHHELVDMAGKSATMRGVPDWSPADHSSGLRQEINGLHAGFRMLAREIRDKKETHINITEKGIWAAQQRGAVWEEWINNNVRL